MRPQHSPAPDNHSPTIRTMSDSRSYLPERIASLQPSVTVTLHCIGELDRVIACTKYCADVVPEVKGDLHNGRRRIIADSWTSKSSEILAAKPDLVIAAVPYQEAAVTEILKAGIRFLGFSPSGLNDIYTDIAIIAGSVGARDRGAQVIREMQSAIADMRNQTQGLPRKRVFAKNGENRSLPRSLGLLNSSTLPAENSLALPEDTARPKKSPAMIPK